MESTIVADEKSTHKIEIFTLTNLEKHPNADTLSITKIADTEYTYVAKTEDWQNHLGKPVAWIPPDSLINPMTKGCEFLAGERRYDKDSNKISDGKYVRIKAKKIRNIVSYGLLIPLNDESEVSALDIQHYEPPINMTSGKTGVKWISGEVASPPEGNFPKYDVDAFMKYAKKVFIDGELVNVTEKIHGCLHEDSEILLSNNTKKKIKDIKIGELVKTYNESTKKFENSEVIDVIIQESTDKLSWIEFEIENGEKIKVTHDHRFLTKNRGWVEARNLDFHDELVCVSEK